MKVILGRMKRDKQGHYPAGAVCPGGLAIDDALLTQTVCEHKFKQDILDTAGRSRRICTDCLKLFPR